MVGLGGLGLRNLLRPPGSPPPPPVRSPEPLDTLIEVGVLEPRVIERIATPINGTLTVAIEDGARVEKGGLLFLLDEEEIRSRIEQQQESIEQKLEEIEIARGDLEEVVNTYASVHRLELAELQHAELELAERERGLLPEERRLLEISIELAELDLEDRRARLERQRELVRQNFAAPTSLDVHLRETEAAEALLRERRTQLELQTQPLPEEERLTLQSAVDQARDIVERSQRRHDRELARRRLEIEGHEIQLRHQRRDLEDREWELDQVRVISPANGIMRLMRRLNWRSRTWQTIAVGQQVWGRDILGELVDPDDLILRLLIHESDILRVRPGQPATARLTAYPEHEVRGRVASVTQLGQDRMDLTPVYRQSPPTRQAQFLAEIHLEPHNLPAMPGMTATVVIELGEASP